MKKILTLIACFAFAGTASAQSKYIAKGIDTSETTYTIDPEVPRRDTSKIVDTSIIFAVVEQAPQFIGGQAALAKYFRNNIQYPEKAKENNIQGRVIVRFVIFADGSIGKEEIVRESTDSSFSIEALRLIKAMPKWLPGKQNGIPVKTYYTLPVKFNLTEYNSPGFKPKSDDTLKTSTSNLLEQNPEYIGGEVALNNFIAKNIKYPKAALKSNIQGRVVLRFTINKDGSISDIMVTRGIGGGCDEEAVRLVKSMPKWLPGKKDGKLVRVMYTLPITFKLNN